MKGRREQADEDEDRTNRLQRLQELARAECRSDDCHDGRGDCKKDFPWLRKKKTDNERNEEQELGADAQGRISSELGVLSYQPRLFDLAG